MGRETSCDKMQKAGKLNHKKNNKTPLLLHPQIDRQT
jgi:hypothetical protein